MAGYEGRQEAEALSHSAFMCFCISGLITVRAITCRIARILGVFQEKRTFTTS